MRYLFKIAFSCLFCFFIATIVRAQHPSDPLANKETVNLYRNLYSLSHEYTLFGHQDDMAYGVNWNYKKGKSDVKAVVGEYPGIFGWDLGHIELGHENNLDGVPFSKMKQYIREGYKMGSAITISWHARNPLTGESAWDTTHHTVKSILPGGQKHTLYLTWLDRVAAFLGDLKDEKGTAIPILFRPYHEFTGNWFWWCNNACTAEEFKELWRMTVHYLRTEKKLHNLLIVFNTAEIRNQEEFYKRYPGDDVVDVISMDTYQHAPDETREAFIGKARGFLKILAPVAAEKKKILAFAETGYEGVPDAEWWTKTLLTVLKDFPVAWVLVWRNHGYMASTGKMHYYAPYKKQASARDFKQFHQNPRILFQKKIKLKNLYSQ